MTHEQVIAFVLFSAAAAGTPGPSNAMLASTGASAGLVRGLPALLGVGAGMGAMMFLVAAGLGAALFEHAAVATVARWCGAAYLLLLAWRTATAGGPGGPPGPSGVTRPTGFLGAAALQAVNPKAWLVCGSAVATFLPQEAGDAASRAGTLALLFVVTALPSCFPWLAFGAALQRVLRGARAATILNAVMAALLAASVLLFVR